MACPFGYLQFLGVGNKKFTLESSMSATRTIIHSTHA